MSVREYVGARYVPLIMGAWSSSKTYEPLSVVTYQGNSYTSRQYVPSGISITNTKYWVQSGNYDAQVENYRQEVLTFNDRINTELEKKLSNSKYIIIGDSWNAGAIYNNMDNPNIANGWGYKLMSKLNVPSSNYINKAQPSAGYFSQGGSQNKTYYTLLTEAYSQLSQSERNEIDYIIVGGAVNDSSKLNSNTITESQLEAAIQSFANYANVNFPNAQLVVFPMLWDGFNQIRQSDRKTKQIIIRTLFSYKRVKVCEYSSEWLIGFKAYEGEIGSHHTTGAGMTRVAAYMAEFMTGSDARVYYASDTVDTTATTAVTWTRWNFLIKDGMIFVNSYGKINDNYNDSSPTALPFAVLPNGNTFFQSLLNQNISCMAVISGSVPPIMCTLVGGEVKLSSRMGQTLENKPNIYLTACIPYGF